MKYGFVLPTNSSASVVAGFARRAETAELIGLLICRNSEIAFNECNGG